MEIALPNELGELKKVSLEVDRSWLTAPAVGFMVIEKLLFLNIRVLITVNLSICSILSYKSQQTIK